MNREQIIQMAREIAAEYSKAERFQTWTHDYMMQRLMELVAAEREACAKVCENFADVDSGPDGIEQDYHAKLIRARDKHD